MRKRIRFITNPFSGRGRSLQKASQVMDLLRKRGCEVEVVPIEGPHHARIIAAESGGFDALVSVGGDGTLNEVANGLSLDNGPPLAMIPAGTANVLAKEIGLPGSAKGLADVIAEGRELRWDLGVERVSGRKFLLFVSAGFDAQVVHDFHRQRKGRIHMADYVWWGVRTFVGFKAPVIRVELDGTTVEERASWVVVSNVSSYGGPIVFTPRARFDDGRFEVMIQRGRQRTDTMHLFGTSLVSWATGWDVRPRDVTCHGASRVRLTPIEPADVSLQVDGDPGGFLPADLELLPGALRVLAPAVR